MVSQKAITEVLKVLDKQGVPDVGLTIDQESYVTVSFMVSDQDHYLEADKVKKVLSERMTVYVKDYRDPLNFIKTIRGERK